VAEKAREIDPSEVAQGGVSSRAVKEKGTAMSESAKKGAYQFRDEVESYLREKFPKQRRDAVVNRLKKVITDIQENPEYQETVDFVVEIMKGYVKKIKEVAEEAVDRDDGVKLKTDEHWDIAVKDIQVRC
jgi:phage gp36-like protein